jgi:hypothetical protein
VLEESAVRIGGIGWHNLTSENPRMRLDKSGMTAILALSKRNKNTIHSVVNNAACLYENGRFWRLEPKAAL